MRQRTLRAVDLLPLRCARVHGVGRAVDDHTRGVEIVRVTHARRGRAVVPVVHDPRDRVHAQIGDDVLAPLIEEMRTHGVRAAVRAHVAADRADRSVDVRDERALRTVERVFGTTTVARREQRLVPVEDVDARRRAHVDHDLVVEPPVAEVPAVERRRHRGVLGIGPGREVIGGLVRARQQPERVVDVVTPGAGRERGARAAEQEDEARRACQRVDDLDARAAVVHDGRGLAARGRKLRARVARHERDLVERPEHSAARARVGVRVGVDDDVDAVRRVRRLSVHGVELDDLALVDLYRDLRPRVRPAERHDVAHRHAEQRGNGRTADHDRVVRARLRDGRGGSRRGDAPAGGGRDDHRDRERESGVHPAPHVRPHPIPPPVTRAPEESRPR